MNRMIIIIITIIGFLVADENLKLDFPSFEEIIFANNAVERDSRIDAFLARNNRRHQ